jgi:quercetin dioxygenase-like cupin family protein
VKGDEAEVMETRPQSAVFRLDELNRRRGDSEEEYREFLRRPALSAGVYELATGATDSQQPHAEDEVYYVAGGRARFQAAGTTSRVEPGCIIFVRAGVEHRFVEIEEDLRLLVFFVPAPP